MAVGVKTNGIPFWGIGQSAQYTEKPGCPVQYPGSYELAKLQSGCGGQNRFGVPFWLVGELPPILGPMLVVGLGCSLGRDFDPQPDGCTSSCFGGDPPKSLEGSLWCPVKATNKKGRPPKKTNPTRLCSFIYQQETAQRWMFVQLFFGRPVWYPSRQEAVGTMGVGPNFFGTSEPGELSCGFKQPETMIFFMVSGANGT